MSENMFAPGTEVFSIDGRSGAYVTGYEGDHIVAPLYEHPDGGVYQGEPEVWRAVFVSPPAPRIDRRVIELEERANALLQELVDLRKQKLEAEQHQQELLGRLTKVKALERIEQHLDGKFQFLVVVPPYAKPVIKPAAEALDSGDPCEKGQMKLLSLFGKSGGDLQWRLNQYYDGSGAWVDVYPCETEEEARNTVRSLFDAEVQEWRATGKGKAFRWLDRLPAGLVDIPDDIKAHLREKRLAELRKREGAALESLRVARDAIAEIGGAA